MIFLMFCPERPDTCPRPSGQLVRDFRTIRIKPCYDDIQYVFHIEI